MKLKVNGTGEHFKISVKFSANDGANQVQNEICNDKRNRKMIALA